MIILLDSKSKGFLSEFINSSYKRYTEPQKKGVPKGDPIGYTTAKNGAVLLDLTSLSIKEQAEVLHTSYGVLRKWRTEFEFSIKREQVADEFLNYYVMKMINDFKIESQAKERLKSFQMRNSKEILRNDDSLKHIVNSDFYNDSELYKQGLIISLFNGMLGIEYDYLNNLELLNWVKVVYIYQYFKDHLKNEQKDRCLLYEEIVRSFSRNVQRIPNNKLTNTDLSIFYKVLERMKM